MICEVPALLLKHLVKLSLNSKVNVSQVNITKYVNVDDTGYKELKTYKLIITKIS